MVEILFVMKGTRDALGFSMRCKCVVELCMGLSNSYLLDDIGEVETKSIGFGMVYAPDCRSCCSRICRRKRIRCYMFNISHQPAVCPRLCGLDLLISIAMVTLRKLRHVNGQQRELNEASERRLKGKRREAVSSNI